MQFQFQTCHKLKDLMDKNQIPEKDDYTRSYVGQLLSENLNENSRWRPQLTFSSRYHHQPCQKMRPAIRKLLKLNQFNRDWKKLTNNGTSIGYLILRRTLDISSRFFFALLWVPNFLLATFSARLSFPTLRSSVIRFS